MSTPTSFNLSFSCNAQYVQLSFSTVTPNHVAVGGFENMVHIIDGNLYSESPAATPREVAPISGMSVGTMPIKKASTGFDPPHDFRAYAADSKLYKCYQDAKKSTPSTTTPEQDNVVAQFFASAIKTFPSDKGVECTGNKYNPIMYSDLKEARVCQAAVESFWGTPFTVYSHTSWFGWGSLKGHTVEPSCNDTLQYSNATVNGAEDANRCKRGRDRMGMPSKVESFCNKDFICTYTVVPGLITSAAK